MDNVTFGAGFPQEKWGKDENDMSLLRVQQVGRPSRFYASWQDYYDGLESQPVGQWEAVDHGDPDFTVAETRAVISPLDGAWQDIRDKAGPRFSNALNGGVVNRPSAFCKSPDGNILLGQFSNAPIIVNPLTGAIVATLPIPYQNPQAGNTGMGYVTSAAYSPDGSKLALGNYYRHLVRIYDTSTWAMISEIGVPSSAGNPQDGKLFRVYGDCLWIDNNTIAVPSYQGTHAPSGSPAYNDRGSITVWDVSSATAVLDRFAMWSSLAALPAVGSSNMRRPMDIRRDPIDANAAYISAYENRMIVRVADITAAEWVVSEVYLPPSGLTEGGNTPNFVNPWGFDVSPDGKELLVAPNGQDIIAMDLQTRELNWSRSKNSNGTSGGWWSIAYVNDDFFIVSDWNQAAAFLLPTGVDASVSFDPITLPEGFVFDRIAIGQPGVLDVSDLSAPSLSVNFSDLGNVGEIDVLFSRA